MAEEHRANLILSRCSTAPSSEKMQFGAIRTYSATIDATAKKRRCRGHAWDKIKAAEAERDESPSTGLSGACLDGVAQGASSPCQRADRNSGAVLRPVPASTGRIGVRCAVTRCDEEIEELDAGGRSPAMPHEHHCRRTGRYSVCGGQSCAPPRGRFRSRPSCRRQPEASSSRFRLNRRGRHPLVAGRSATWTLTASSPTGTKQSSSRNPGQSPGSSASLSILVHKPFSFKAKNRLMAFRQHSLPRSVIYVHRLRRMMLGHVFRKLEKDYEHSSP